MHGIPFIQDLAVILIVAGAVGWICQRVGLAIVVGFLAAGILIGPYTPMALVTDIGRAQTFAQIGLVFLMFSIGLRLSLRKLRRLGLSLVLAVFSGAAVVFYLTRLTGAVAGFSNRESLFLAAMLMVSSSSIISKVLQETGATHERFGQFALGVTVLEDVVAVVMLTLLNSIVQFGGVGPAPIGETLGLFGAFVVLAGVCGSLLVPWLMTKLSISAGEELQTIALAGMLFALAMVAQRAGYSLALGAFLLGTIVAETPHRTHVERTFEGMRDVFTAVFFVAIGMQIDPRMLWDSLGAIVGIAVLALLIRTGGMALGMSIIGTPARDALRVGFAVTPIGEFSFIIAQLGVVAGVVPPRFYPLAVGVSLITTLTAPLLTRHSAEIGDWILARRPQALGVWQSYYQTWLTHLQARQKRNLIWQLSKKRIVQIGVEMLFITGLLVFSEPLLRWVERWLGHDWLFPHGPTVLFWLVLSLVVLAPLIAVWRNLSALCLLLAQVSTSGHAHAAKLRPVVELAFKIVAGTAIYVWLSTLLPMEGYMKWVVLASAGMAVVALALMRRRLIYWHSELEVELQDVFRGHGQMAPDLNAPWLRPHADWNLSVIDCVLPDLADAQGKCIADLGLRARFGCTVVGVGRQGYMISLPAPDVVLYPRDKVLLLGTAAQVEEGKKFLQTVSGVPPTAVEYEDVRMETIAIPHGSRLAGQDLKTLSLAKNFHVQIAGIRRGETRTLSPDGDERLAAGDELLVLGMPDSIRDFRDWMEETSSDPASLDRPDDAAPPV